MRRAIFKFVLVSGGLKGLRDNHVTGNNHHFKHWRQQGNLNAGSPTSCLQTLSFRLTKLHEEYRSPHRTTLKPQLKDPPTGDQAEGPPTGDP
jgi:hypothetical protein